MYALERYKAARWQRYAVCSQRRPLDRVVRGFSDAKKWRIVDTSGIPEKHSDKKRAA